MQQRNTLRPEAIEENALHRAAGTDETAAQRIERQQSMVSPQLKNTDKALARTPNGDPCACHSDRCQLEPCNDILQGVGSQFSGVSDPSFESGTSLEIY